MLDFKPNFYKKVFQSVETSSVLMKIEENGEKYFPIWCSKEFSEMMKNTFNPRKKAHWKKFIPTTEPKLNFFSNTTEPKKAEKI